MKAIILCAGYATRLYPLTKDKPKPLLTVGNKPILNHILLKLEEVEEVDTIYVITNSKFFPHFTEWAKETNLKNIEIVDDGTTSNEDRLGSLGDIDFVIENKNIEDDILIIAGDNLFDLCLNDMKQLFKAENKTVIALYDVKEKELAKQYGVVEINQQNKLIHFVEKPENPASTLASTGIYMIPKADVNLLKKYFHEGHSKDKIGSFFEWLHNKEDVYCFVSDRKWYDIGTIDQLKKADQEYTDE